MPESEDNNNPTVFISYAHEDDEWLQQLLPHLDLLVKEGRIELWHDEKIDAGADWYDEIRAAMKRASVAVCLVSQHFLSSDFITREEIPYLLERREQDGMLLVPVLVRPCLYEAVDRLKRIQMLPGKDRSIAIDYKGKEDVAWVMVARRIYKKINEPSFTAAKAPSAWPALPEECVYIERLPQTGTVVFGRQAEEKIMDEAWESAETNILAFVAWGGVGKSALVNKWVARMEADNFREAKRVYAWSFYSQGTGQRVTSADMFIDQALRWFGDDETADSTRSAWDKGRRLAELVQAEKTLLILDGMEPLQSGFQHDKGQVNDPALAVLLKQLSRKNPGLCVITTRERLAGLEVYDDVIRQENLEQISEEAGRALLRVGGIRGTDAELEQITRDFGNHALAVGLLVPYLQTIPGREIENARLIPDLDIPVEDGKHPRRVMQAWTKYFGDGPELDVLHMMGLFDRPASKQDIKAFLTRSEILGLTEHIRWLTNNEWNDLVERLRHYGLIAPPSHHNLGGLDAHPLVREHFSRELQETNIGAWRQGHGVLFDYLSSSTIKYPDTLEEMTPLFLAVAHGCLAGRHQEALNPVYAYRIQRGNVHYLQKKLGAFGADLAVLAGLFDPPWENLIGGLIDQAKGVVLNDAGSDLRALGRLTEALGPMKAGLEAHRSHSDWRRLSMSAANLCGLSLALGDLGPARKYAKQSIKYADDSGDDFLIMGCRTYLADTHFQSGRMSETEALFRESEEMQKKSQPKYQILYSLSGFGYCDLLLDLGKHAEAHQRAEKTLNWVTEQSWLLDIALDHLTLGRAYLLAALEAGNDDFSQVKDHLDQAVDGLRRAGTMHHLPRGPLARVEFYRHTSEFSLAIQDLDEAWDIAQPSGMRLFECDIHLECARLLMAMHQAKATLPELYPDSPLALFNPTKDLLAAARQHIQAAQKLIEDTGYHRRDADIPLLSAHLLALEGHPAQARESLDQAREIINRQGLHRLDYEVNQISALWPVS